MSRAVDPARSCPGLGLAAKGGLVLASPRGRAGEREDRASLCQLPLPTALLLLFLTPGLWTTTLA